MSLNRDAITDQKQAPGLIENPCRDALIELAGLVPADLAVVELGAFKGRSTGHLVLGAQQGNGAHVYSVDPWDEAPELTAEYLRHAPSVAEYQQPTTREIYEAHLEATGARPYVTTIQATAVEAAATYDGPKVGLLFHDALHRLEDVRDDLKAWLPHMDKTAVVVLHDVGDPRLGVEAGAQIAFTRTKTLREKWDWEGRDIHLWAKQPTKRGYAVVRTH